MQNMQDMNRHMSGVLDNLRNQVPKAASTIAAAEDSLSAARALANRVEHIIDRLCGTAGLGAGGIDKSEPTVLPVLIRLRRASDDTDDAISRANAALDRLDVELN